MLRSSSGDTSIWVRKNESNTSYEYEIAYYSAGEIYYSGGNWYGVNISWLAINNLAPTAIESVILNGTLYNSTQAIEVTSKYDTSLFEEREI